MSLKLWRSLAAVSARYGGSNLRLHLRADRPGEAGAASAARDALAPADSLPDARPWPEPGAHRSLSAGLASAWLAVAVGPLESVVAL
ncbi:hypothetical protein SAMN04488058_103131 [Deinococcus reticulitermitis]|uniref:Uncharacterized protein n=1 Tax=Deinococcus reticulitermitis TaxID=856736 RepID=A0A1H6VD78_9DEIO|nr:hypothetical protein SAMN04488058_103131 [Deinococcus reticulitermitis]